MYQFIPILTRCNNIKWCVFVTCLVCQHEVSYITSLYRDPSTQGRLLRWSMDATCVLEKTRGERKSCIFSWKLGKGEERLNYLSTYLHCFPLIFSARSITFYFHPPIKGRGTYMAGTVKSVSLLKVGRHRWGSLRCSSRPPIICWGYDKVPPCTHWTVTSHLMSAAEKKTDFGNAIVLGTMRQRITAIVQSLILRKS